LLLDAFHGRQTKIGLGHTHTIESLNELVRVYEAWGKPDLAEHGAASWPGNSF